MRRPLLAFFAIGFSLGTHAQVNAYAQVTAFGGLVLTLGAVDETYDTFEDGEQAILMQMQDDVAGPNLLNGFTFGNVSTINSAGFWEIITIASHTEAAGVPTSVTLAAGSSHVFHFGAKCAVQLISFPQFGTPDYTTTGPVTARSWNATTGGVAAFQVTGTLTLAHDITANGAGFRGGATSLNYASSCANLVYTTASTNYGEKGDGIQRVDLTGYRYGRGKLVTAGGGGNPRNAGGAGGGNCTVGGAGGGGYGCLAGGIPGISTMPYVWYDRLFMGSGGGGGQQNNSLGGAGGAGGGMVILKMQTLHTVAPCPGLKISANGADGASSIGAPPDGAGGGGSGGTVYLFVNVMDVDAGCTVTCEANGGNGGSVTNTTPGNGWPDTGGGGGGGGQGYVICGGAAGAGGAGGAGWAGMSGHTAPGTGGTHAPSGATASSGTGSADAGVMGFGGAMLPVELLAFSATADGARVRLDWSTATEVDNALFRVWRSIDHDTWSPIAEVPGANNSQELIEYRAFDNAPATGTNFYHLESIDHSGASAWSDVVAVEWRGEAPVILFPNPAGDVVTISSVADNAGEVVLTDLTGRVVLRSRFAAGVPLDVHGLSAGTYSVAIQPDQGITHTVRLTIAR